ncbi:hypothetical protein JTE90_021504 [Oedothorax gibbosus]|uniref:Uncharacterized protein n=1 Tax=Oedothorax gibbosus TaxID=931172 RepID=A0AAV6VNK5_9ARAC|nr:hypothetical protein JTE90_021504 [Oedothorax gibbosus]
MQNAIMHVEKGHSIYAEEYKVPEQTIRRWVNETSSRRLTFLTQEEETGNAEALKFLARCGFPFDRTDILNLVETYLNSNVQRNFSQMENLEMNG